MAGKASVLLRIVDRAGNPVADACVSAVGKNVLLPEFGLMSNAEGLVTVFLPSGAFQVRAVSEDGQSGEAEIDVPGPASMSVTIKVAPASEDGQAK